LHDNPVRLGRHFSLKNQTGRDPLNAAALAKGHHQSDAETYRGLGYRTDAKERGRFVELFYIQADKGEGITGPLVDLAIKKYHAKQAILEVQTAQKMPVLEEPLVLEIIAVDGDGRRVDSGIKIKVQQVPKPIKKGRW
jgi:hypothetical protein